MDSATASNTTDSVYTVKASTFEGPLELLLSLIEARKFFINEISLADVTNDYIAHIRSLSDSTGTSESGMSDKHIADVSYFILIAATLILIKSKSLLPNLQLTDDEEEKIENLEHRLKLYQIIKNASVEVKNAFGVAIVFSPLQRTWSDPVFSPDPAITTSSMLSAVSQVLASVPKEKEKLPEVEIKKMISLDEMINSLTDRMQSAMNMSFRDFAKSHGAQSEQESKVHIIVSFLAMLELVRGGIIDVIQDSSWGDIQINATPPSSGHLPLAGEEEFNNNL
jgi:segregation and condensation protein A